MTLQDRIQAKQQATKAAPVTHVVEASSYEYDCGICPPGTKHTGPCPNHPADVEDLPSAADVDNGPEGN